MNQLLQKKVKEKERRWKSLQAAWKLFVDHTGNKKYMAQTVRKDFREHSQTLGLETMVNTMVKRVTGSGIVSCKKKKKKVIMFK